MPQVFESIQDHSIYKPQLRTDSKQYYVSLQLIRKHLRLIPKINITVKYSYTLYPKFPPKLSVKLAILML